MIRCLVLIAFLGMSPTAFAEDGLVGRWQFTAEHVKDGKVKALAGPLDGVVVGSVEFSTEPPKALVLNGNSAKKHRIVLSEDIAKANLPRKAITAEAWVWIDRAQEWGGIIGALQDNGAYEKGWLLGHQRNQFFFAVASKGRKNLTYLHARNQFQPGCWYHVAGVYDGVEQRLYVDGKLQASSREQSGDIDYPPRAFFTAGAYHDDDEVYSVAGRLEQVSVHSQALTAEQVGGLFRQRKDRFPGVDPVAPSVTDWPTYLRDNQRRGITEEKPALPLRLRWVYRSRLSPRPAWPEEAKHDYFHNKFNMPERVIHDSAFHVVGAGDMVCFASSADDRVHCLDVATGRERWSFVTEGPVRLAPTIVDDLVLFGSDDGFVYAVKSSDGALVWRRRIGPEPRRIPGNERVISAWPVRTDVLVEDGKAYACAGVFPSQGVFQVALELRDGRELERQTLKVTAQGYLERQAGQLRVGTGRNPAGEFVAKLNRAGKEIGKEASALGKDYRYAFIGAGDVRFGGGDNTVAAFARTDGKLLWSAPVEGRVFSLAYFRGRLLAGTDRGFIYCFTSDAGEPTVITPPAPTELVYPDAATKERYTSAAQWIIDKANLTRGWCLVQGSDEGLLACELARRTNWQIIGREPDADKVARSRRLIDAAGLSGRVSIHHGPLEALPYTDYLFNVVAGDALARDGKLPGPRTEALRVLRPHGGLAVFALDDKGLVRRGPLEGAGEWTHMYADPANTACSGDRLVGQAVQLQWFGPPGPKTMIDRHHRTVPPVYQDGRLFVPGEDRVTAVDAYNGTILWDREIANSRRVAAFRDSSYLVSAAEGLYVAAADRCLVLDPRTGREERVLALPDASKDGKYEWGYLARSGPVLVGSGVKAGSIRREQSNKMTLTETHYDAVPAVGSDFVFALNAADAKPLWTYRARTGLIVNPTLTIAGGRVYFIESSNAATLTAPLAHARLADLVGQGARLTALDLQTGKVVWTQTTKAFAALEHNVFAASAHELLVVVGSRNSGNDPKKDHVVYDVHVFDATTGEPRWSKSQTQPDRIKGEHGEQERHPVIVGNTLYCEPAAYDLRTGARAEWKWPWTAGARRGCGTLSASASCLFFRDETLSAFDLAAGKARPLTAETRPGCWINMLPVGGLVLTPEASSGCSCNHSVQTSLALIPVRPTAKE